MLKTYDVRAEFQGPVQIERTSTKFIVVHHAAALYPTYAGIDDVRTVHRYHAQKWPDFRAIGYHWAIAEETQDGPLARYVLSDPHLQRAHVALRNHEAFGISCLTNFTGMPAQEVD